MGKIEALREEFTKFLEDKMAQLEDEEAQEEAMAKEVVTEQQPPDPDNVIVLSINLALTASLKPVVNFSGNTNIIIVEGLRKFFNNFVDKQWEKFVPTEEGISSGTQEEIDQSN